MDTTIVCRLTAVACLAWIFCASGAAADSLALQYIERPPFNETRPDGTVGGVSAAPVAEAFEKAGIAVSWTVVPAARQLARLQRNDEAVCSVGWYKTAEREKFAKFSNPVSQDSSMIGLAHPRLEVPTGATLDALLARPDLTIVLKEAAFYGPYLDGKLAQMRAVRLQVSAEFDVIVRMVQKGRAQLTFIPLEEAVYYTGKAGLPMSDFQILRFAGMPPGEKRYLMCSQKVEDEVIRQVNKFLPPLLKPDS